VAYWLLLLLPTLAVGGAAILLLRKEQDRLAAQQATAGEARRAAATARAGLIVENTELLVGDMQTALLDTLAQMPPAGLEAGLAQWEKANPLVRTAWLCTSAGRILRPAANADDEEARAFRRRFAPLLETNPPWRAPAASLSPPAMASAPAEADMRNQQAEMVRQQAYSNVAKVQTARRDAKVSSSLRDYAYAKDELTAAAPAAGLRERSEGEAEPGRRGWTPWSAEGRLHVLGWVERPAAGEVRGVELELAAVIARLGGALPAEVQAGEGYVLRDEKGRLMHQAGWVPRDGALPVASLRLSDATLPGWEVVAFLALVGLGVGVDTEVTGVESLDDSAGGPTLSAGVRALHDHEQPGPDVLVADLAAERESECDESFLRGRQALFVLLGSESCREVDVVQSSHAWSTIGGGGPR